MNKDQFFAAVTPKVTEIVVDSLGQLVRFRQMTAGGRDALAAHAKVSEDVSRYQAAIIVATVVDEHGESMFSPEDMEKLLTVPHAVLDELADHAMRVCGLGASSH